MITLLILVSLPASFSNALYDRYVACAPVPFKCGDLEFTVAYPFNMDSRPTFCGHPGFNLYCNDNSTLTTTINSKVYQVIRPIDYENGIITIIDPDFANQSCPNKLANTTIDTSLYFASSSDRNVTLYLNCTTPSQVSGVSGIGCLSGIYGQHSYLRVDNGALGDVMGQCSSTIAVPVAQEAAEQLASSSIGLGEALQEGFHLTWLAGMGWCGSNCIDSGGFCGYNSILPNEHICFCRHGLAIDSCSGNNGRKRIITAIVATGTAASVLACAICIFCYRQKQNRHSSSTVPFKSFSPDSPAEKDPESVSSGYQTHLFSYDELLEATNSFDASKELGDGGFGTVYKGKLRDGRVVAVKRLYDNNYKRVEQFLNEVVILSQLRHRSLVTLYGCTSRRSRELLLVYEFISNGTVADHLHGSPSPDPALTWPLRLRIAVESADALAYLHAIDPPIIHRDVKTANILLDDDFHVKVADFGLSRLFPVDATHVSTAPQGTPGYVDPEYHQYYQLTDKSDVYSFGVVLIELISSKPAVDVSRHRDEINLSSMAMKKIQEGKLDHLVDPALGFESDMEVRRMITVVAELAFRCLQIDREMRPTIKEVLEELRRVESGDYREEEKGGKYSGEPFSPDTVIERWSSRSSTPSTRSG